MVLVAEQYIFLILCQKYTLHISYTLPESDRLLDDICEGCNTVPHENLYIRKPHLQKTLEITEI